MSVENVGASGARGHGARAPMAPLLIRHWVYKHTGKDKDYEAYKEALNAATNEVRKSKQHFEHKLKNQTVRVSMRM